jgi:signal transduction histidine kinase
LFIPVILIYKTMNQLPKLIFISRFSTSLDVSHARQCPDKSDIVLAQSKHSCPVKGRQAWLYSRLFETFLLSFLLIFQVDAHLLAATPDSLYVQVNSHDKKVALRALNALVSLQVDSLPGKCMDYARHAQQLAKELKDNKEIANADFSLASCFDHMTQLDSARYYYNKALEGFQVAQDKEKIVGCLNNLAILYKQQGNYAKALDLQLKVLSIRKQLGNQRDICQVYNNLGNLYLTIRDTTRAIEFYMNGKEIAEKSNDSIANIYLGLNLGRMMACQKQFEKAKPILLRVLKLSQEKHLIIGKVSAMNLLSYIEQVNNNDEGSFRLADEALQISLKYDYMQGAINSHDLLGKYYQRKGEYQQGLDHYNKALTICNKSNLNERQHDLHRSISEIYELMQLPGKALDHFKAYSALKDSLYNKENDQQLASIQYKHELENNENEKMLLEEKYKKQQQQQAFTFVLVILLLLIITMLAVLIYKHRQARKYLIELNEQKDRMFSLISHDLRGPIGSIKSLFDLILDNEDITPSEMKSIITESKEVIDSTYNLLENLLNWGRSQTGRIAVHPQHVDIVPLVSQSLKLFSPSIQKKNIRVTNTVNEKHQVYADKEMIEAVIRNLISNAIKFTYPKGEISVSSQEEGHQIILTVSDSGTGMNKGTIRKILEDRLTSGKEGTFNERGAGIGLRICHDFVLRNNGQLTIESEVGKGSRFSVILPVSPHTPEYKSKTRNLYQEQTGHRSHHPTVPQYSSR